MKKFTKLKTVKILCFFLALTIGFSLLKTPPVNCFADTPNNSKEIYIVYDNNRNIIYEGNKVYVGDKIIDKTLNEFEIYYVDDVNNLAYAEYTGRYEKPNVSKKSKSLFLSNKSIPKSVGLYMTHNDESYTPSDGTSSVYGKGGIHDVTKEFASCLKNLNYDVYVDETLHLPHDSGAYSRSNSTAKNLLNKNVDALFDIHRDGVSRSVYVKNVDGVERCKVRIVVGQANPNKEANLQFAMYLVSVAEEYCPWLFLDIYYAKGHYNQQLTSKGLLFEMGTYLAEKELVLKTVPYLANIVDKTLFSTVVEEDNNIIITDTPTPEQQDKIVNNILNKANYNSDFWSNNLDNIIVFSVLFISIMSIIIFVANNYNKKKRVA